MKRAIVLGATLALLLAPLLVRLLKAQPRFAPQSPTPSQPTYFVVSVPAVVTPTPALVTVGSVFNFMVTIRDQYNNPVSSYTGIVHFTSTDPQAMLPSDYTFNTGDSGTHMFSATLNTPGTQTITATDTANTAITGTSNSIAVRSAPAPPGPTFTLTDLGPLNITAAPSGATALNASGQVTGFRFENFSTQVCFASGANRAFLWSNGVYTELGTLGGYSSFGYGINNAGQLVGSSDLCPNGLEVGQRAFIWLNGSMTALDPSTNSNDSSVAFAINTNGDVAGYLNHSNAPVAPQAAIWKGGTAAGLTLLGSLACQFAPNCQTRALAINDSGQAAGWGTGPFVTGPAGSYNASQAVMWDMNGQATGLGSLGNYFDDQANAINSKGDVVGYSRLDPSVYYSITRAVLWPNGNGQNPQDLGTIPGIDPLFGSSANVTDSSSAAWAINSKGFIVGVSGSGSNVAAQGNSGRAFLYIPAPTPGNLGTMYDLLSLLAPSTSWRRLEAAWAISDNGQIVGVGIDPNQQEHGFLLTPVITPTSTTVTTSTGPSVFGQQASFAATVTPAPPNANAVNDTVTFSDGGATLGTGTYSGNGVWIFNTVAPLPVGNHSITASFSGDNNFASSTSAAVTQTVGQASTATSLVASATTVNAGQAVTFTATINVVAPGAGTPTRTVTFFANGAPLACTGGSQTVSTGQATCQFAFGTTGAQSVTASYSGDPDFAGSTTTSAVTVTVQSPPPSAPPVVQINDNETITVTDAESFPDVFDAEAVHVTDSAFVTPLIQVSAPVAEFSAGSLGFNGQSGSQTITVSDIGLASLTLASATISGSSQFVISQVACSNNTVSLSTVLPSGGVCTITVGYAASATPANDNATLTFTDNAALSNLQVFPSGSSYTQSIPLNGSVSSTAPPSPPPAVIPIPISETIHVTNAESFPDVFDAEAVHVSDVAFVTPEINVAAPVVEFSAGSMGFSGQSGSQTITVSDIGQASLTVTSATISGSSQFAITQISCTNTAASFSTVLPSGGVCAVTIAYTASTTPANDNAALTFTDNAALSNLQVFPSGSNYTQSIPLNGSGTSTAPPPPPPAVIPIPISETIHVSDAESFPDVFDAETIKVADQVLVQAYPLTTTSVTGPSVTYGTPALTTVSVSSASGSVTGNVALSVDGGTPAAMALTNGSAIFNLSVLNAGTHSLLASFATQGGFSGSSASTTLAVSRATPVITWANPAPIPSGTALTGAQLNATASVPGSFLYTPAVGTVLSAGSHTLSVTFSPSDSTDYTTATASVTITVLNTTVGTNIGVTPVDTTTGLTPVTLNFSNVAKAGITSLTTSSTGVAPPPNFEVPTPIVYYDISTTATFTGTVQVCFHYANLLFFGSTAPHVFHLEGGVWVDRTTTIDPVNLVVCGVVPSLSPFALFAPKPVLTITANNASRQFGAPDPSFSVSFSGFVGTDTPAVLSGTLSCSGTDTVGSPVGAYAINCSGSTSPNYTITYAPGVLTVTPASTTTSVSVSPSPVKYSDYTALTATVSPTSAGGQTLTGNVQFSLNGSNVGSAVPINSSGVATLSQVQVNLSAGSYPVKAVFSSTNANFAGSNASATQTVKQENAFILYSGDTIAQVGTSLNLRATVWDSAAVGYPGTNPETGPTATIGDITKMWIAFDIYPAGSCGSGTPSTLYAQVALTGTPGVGTATTSLSSSSEVSYCVVSRLVAGSAGGTNQFYTAANAEAVGVDFYVNSGQFANGGGWVNDSSGSHGNFGFNARYNSTGSPKGQMVYVYRALYNGALSDFIIKSNALTALQFSGTTYPISSTLQGKVNIQVNRASDGYTLFSAGNYTFSATVTDSGQSGTTGKQFSLIVYDTSGVPYHSVPAGTSLQGGNVVVHSQ